MPANRKSENRRYEDGTENHAHQQLKPRRLALYAEKECVQTRGKLQLPTNIRQLPRRTRAKRTF
jgi:hypothetical protein